MSKNQHFVLMCPATPRARTDDAVKWYCRIRPVRSLVVVVAASSEEETPNEWVP